MSLPRMRTIPQVIEELKKQDENTAFCEYYLRKLVRSGEIPHVNAGRKILLCLDTVSEYLRHPSEGENEPENRMRKINE